MIREIRQHFRVQWKAKTQRRGTCLRCVKKLGFVQGMEGEHNQTPACKRGQSPSSAAGAQSWWPSDLCSWYHGHPASGGTIRPAPAPSRAELCSAHPAGMNTCSFALLPSDHDQFLAEQTIRSPAGSREMGLRWRMRVYWGLFQYLY